MERIGVGNMSKVTKETEVAKVEVESPLAIAKDFSALSKETRVRLATLGKRVVAWMKAKHPDAKRSEALDRFETACLPCIVDRSRVERACSLAAQMKDANKHGVFQDWADAGSDKEALSILDSAMGRKRSTPKEKTKYERAVDSLRHLTTDETVRLALHIAQGVNGEALQSLTKGVLERVESASKEAASVSTVAASIGSEKPEYAAAAAS